MGPDGGGGGGGGGGAVESCGVHPKICNGWALCPSILYPSPNIASRRDAMVSVISANWSTVAY